MSPIEITATVFGLLCVALTVKRNVWCWPTGLVQVILYIWVFFGVKLYSDMILQIIYVPLQVYGYWQWKYGSNKKELPLSCLYLTGNLKWFGLTAVLTIGWGYLMTKVGAAAPYADGFVAMASLMATYLMAKKVVECWWYWIAVDVVAVGVYLYKHLYPTTILYAVFLVLAIIGYVAWRKAYYKSSIIASEKDEPTLVAV
jgi:nicotinamide mononucleotide transporter